MVRSKPRLVLLPLLGIAGLPMSCGGHGAYTNELLEQARRDQARLRSATQYDLATQQFQSGDLKRALRTIDEAIALQGEVGRAHLLRGRVLLEMGRTDEAKAALVRGRELDPLNPEFDYYRGVAAERLRRLEEALRHYRSAAALDPTSAQYLLAVVEVLIDLRRFAEARLILTDLDGDLSSHPGILQARGHVALLEGDCEAAVRHFNEAVVLSPGDPVLREGLCYAQVAAGDFAQAELTLRRLSDEPDYETRRDLQHLRASCLLELGRPVEARTILYGLVRSRDGGGDVEAWIRLTDVALMMNDDGLLRDAANRLMAAAPGRYEGYLALALWQRREGDLDGALRSTDLAVERAGGDPAPRRLRELIEQQVRQ